MSFGVLYPTNVYYFLIIKSISTIYVSGYIHWDPYPQ